MTKGKIKKFWQRLRIFLRKKHFSKNIKFLTETVKLEVFCTTQYSQMIPRLVAEIETYFFSKQSYN